MATITALKRIQPKTPDTRTDRTIARGTWWAAPTVSSDVWAEASKPVMVYIGSMKPSAKSQGTLSVRGQTGASLGRPL